MEDSEENRAFVAQEIRRARQVLRKDLAARAAGAEAEEPEEPVEPGEPDKPKTPGKKPAVEPVKKRTAWWGDVE